MPGKLPAEGLEHHQGGRLSEAEDCYRRALAVAPGNADAYHLLGVAAYQSGKLAASLEFISTATKHGGTDPDRGMIRGGFLDAEAKRDLIELARDGSVEHRLGRRANALLLLNNGMSCVDVAKVLFIDDDTVRTWHRLYEEDGIEGLAGFGHEGSACRISIERQDKLNAWIAQTLPRSTREIGAYIEKEFEVTYEERSGLIALLHRLGMVHRKPQAIPRKLDEDKQKAFIKNYNALLNGLPKDEAVMFGDAVHPHARCAAGGLLGAQGCQGRGRTEQRTGPAEYSWCDRPGDRAHAHDRGAERQRAAVSRPGAALRWRVSPLIVTKSIDAVNNNEKKQRSQN